MNKELEAEELFDQSGEIYLGKAFLHTKSGKVFVGTDTPDEEHNCDAMGCATVGPHIIQWLEPSRSSQNGTEGLSLAELRRANVERNKQWDADGRLDVTFRGLEFAGEAGEVCNKLKKLERERRGLRGSRATKEELADELADSIITADLIGMMENVDLTEAVVRVFNRKSDELKLSTHLRSLLSPESDEQGEKK